jgi:hypothetical protein
MELHIFFGEITRRKHGQRTFIIDLAWAITGLLIRYYGNIGLEGSNHKAQLISTYIASGIMELYIPRIEEWNWAIMRENIVGIKAEQKLTRIMIADITPEGINNAFNKLIRKLTIIADLFTLRRKPEVDKGCL